PQCTCQPSNLPATLRITSLSPAVASLRAGRQPSAQARRRLATLVGVRLDGDAADRERSFNCRERLDRYRDADHGALLHLRTPVTPSWLILTSPRRRWPSAAVPRPAAPPFPG